MTTSVTSVWSPSQRTTHLHCLCLCSIVTRAIISYHLSLWMPIDWNTTYSTYHISACKSGVKTEFQLIILSGRRVFYCQKVKWIFGRCVKLFLPHTILLLFWGCPVRARRTDNVLILATEITTRKALFNSYPYIINTNYWVRIIMCI